MSVTICAQTLLHQVADIHGLRLLIFVISLFISHHLMKEKLSYHVSGGHTVESSDKSSRSDAQDNGEENDDSMEVNGEGFTEEVSSNVGSPALSLGANDIFWEQFLTETPDSPVASTDPDMDAEGPSETGALLMDSTVDGTDVFADAIGGGHPQAKDWWSKENVDELSTQMGQLAPG
jgi:hypothetical protein